MATNKERREKARNLRDLCGRDYGEAGVPIEDIERALGVEPVLPCAYDPNDVDELADLIDPDTSSFHDAEWRRWYEGLCHTDGDDSPESLREVLEDIVWAVLTIDLGPNGNVEQGVDDGIVQTESLLDAWEREIREIIEQEEDQ